MGTSMDLIQNAYQGFAKSNYTMLDNLKLGYGGTKEEMERLLEDASKLSGIKYDISSFADVAEAIHVIQENMDIAGTSMSEAMGTVEGSINMTKAAWDNFIVGLGDSNANLTELLGNLVTSVGAALGNILPIVGNLVMSAFTLAVTGIQTGFSQVISLGTTNSNLAIQNVLDTIASRLPEILQKGVDLVTNFANGALQNLPTLITAVGNLLSQGIEFIMQNLPQFLQKGVELVLNLANGVIQNAPTIITAIYNTLVGLLSTIASNMPQFLQKGIEIIAKLAAGLIQAIPQAIAAVPKIVSGIWNAFTSVNWLGLGLNIIRGIGDGIINGVTGLVSAAREAASRVVSSVKNFFGIHSPSTKMRDEVGRYIPAGLAEGIEENSGIVTDAMNDIGDMVVTPVKAPKFETGTSGGFTYGGAITINVYASEGQDAKEIAQEVSEILAKQTQRKKAVYGN